ncbi:unnamed protein product [Hermetia illucens]|uniref:Uncharacterized protein n=1 Tax=Hermetia illucens TaxID=343691 RepID=A0A7R8UFR5_HERIL|nr:unnamed protein product [Hermetia illucens]
MERGEATATTSSSVEQPDHRRYTVGKNRKANRETLRAMMKLAFTREELKQITRTEGTPYNTGTDYNEYEQEIEEARHEHLLAWAKVLRLKVEWGAESSSKSGIQHKHPVHGGRSAGQGTPSENQIGELAIWQSRRGHSPETREIRGHLGGQTAERAVPETRQRRQHQARTERGQQRDMAGR